MEVASWGGHGSLLAHRNFTTGEKSDESLRSESNDLSYALPSLADIQ